MLHTRALLMSGLLMAALSARAGADVISDWAKIVPPPAPVVTPIETDAKTTALLLLDFNDPPCDPAANPRCIQAIPAVKTLLERARSKGLLIVYTLGASTSRDSINPALKALSEEPVISARPDKFLNSDLEKLLKDRGIKTVITTGTTANGAVLYTASEAAFRGFSVLVPTDGVPGLTPYAEQITLWQLANGPRLGGDAVKLTRTDAIAF